MDIQTQTFHELENCGSIGHLQLYKLNAAAAAQMKPAAAKELSAILDNLGEASSAVSPPTYL